MLFHAQEGDVYTKWHVPEDYSDEEGRCLKKEFSESVANKIKGQVGVIATFSNDLKKTSAPTCFSLSSLQKLCNSRFGFTAQQTLKIAQSLYETHKATTYPRTDSGFLPEEQCKEAHIVLSSIVTIDEKLKPLVAHCDVSYQSPTWDDKKVTAHHGIIPTTNTHVSLENMTKEEALVYDLICRYYLAQFMGNYEYNQRKVTVICADETFTANCTIPVVLGWKHAIGQIFEEPPDKQNEGASSIPLL